MEDDQSASVQDNAQLPEETDVITQILADTEDDSTIQAETVEETPEESETDDSETEAEVEPAEGEEEGTQQAEDDPKEEARKRYEERQRRQAEREERIRAVTDEHISGAEDEYDQRLRAMEAQKYRETVEHTEGLLITEFERVKSNPDLQIFNPDNKEQFNERAYNKAMRDFNAGYIDYDQNGNMVGVKGSLFEHLTESAELYSGAVKSGAVQQVKATRSMRANADTKPAAQPKSSQKDEIMEILTAED